MLCFTVLFLSCLLVAHASFHQLVFDHEHEHVPELQHARIFYQVAGAAKMWWQTFAPNNRAVMPTTVPAGTNLYHDEPSASPPQGWQWFAFEPEHSVGVMKTLFPNDNHTMWTYCTRRPLKVLYLDGHAGGKDAYGAQDLQQQLIHGNVTDSTDDRGALDRSLAGGLCALAPELQVDGFIRQVDSFELIGCNFSDTSAYEIVATINSNAHFGPPMSIHDGDALRLADHDPYAQSLFVSQYRAIIEKPWGDPRIVTHPEHMLTLFDERDYPSLVASSRLPIREQRLFDLSAHDLGMMRTELRQISTDWHTGRSSGLAWQTIAQTVVDRYGPRLAEARLLLSNQTGIDQAPLDVLHRAILSIHSMVFPYIDAPIVLETWPRSSLPSAIFASLEQSKKLCVSAFTPTTDARLNHQEKRIKTAIEGVLDRICSPLLDMLGEGLVAKRAGRIRDDVLPRWSREITALMEWLVWPLWQRGDRQCDWEEVLLIKQWPRTIQGDNSSYTLVPPPRCAASWEHAFGALSRDIMKDYVSDHWQFRT